MNTCSTCKHYFAIRPADDQQPGGGQCRRHSPTVGFVPMPKPDLQTGGMTIGIERCTSFPTVAADVWCGEFEPRLAAAH